MLIILIIIVIIRIIPLARGRAGARARGRAPRADVALNNNVRHRLNGRLDNRLPSLSLASISRKAVRFGSGSYVSPEDQVPNKLVLSCDIHTHTLAPQKFYKLPAVRFRYTNMFCKLSWAWAWV